MKTTKEFRKVRIVRNPRSGIIRSQQLVQKSIDLTLAQAPFEYDYFETEYKNHGHELALDAVNNHYDAVIAVGGDGTMNEVASALLHSSTALGVIPLGSGNGLAHGLDIPLSPFRATRLLLKGHIRTIDAGNVNGHIFFIVTGLGFDAVIGKLFNDQDIRGLLPYFSIGFREYFSYKPEVFILKFNDKQVAIPALFVTIANMRGWGGGAVISPEAEPDDGLLDICAIHRASFLYSLFNLPKLFFGGIDKIQRYSRYQAQSVEITRERPGPFHFDGESLDGPDKLSVKLIPSALNVIVPPAS